MIEISPMTPADVPQAAELERLCFTDPWSEASIAYELQSPISLWLTARDGARVLGYIGSQSVPPESDVMNLAVHPEYRRRGLGTALLQALKEQLALRGVTVLALEVRRSNAEAIALYEKHGFTLAGVRKNYYRTPREDALILKSELVSP